MKFFLCQNQPVVALLPERDNGHYSRPAMFDVRLTTNFNADGKEGEFWNELERLLAGADAAGGDYDDVGQLRLICEVFEEYDRLGFRIVSGPVTAAIGKVLGDNAVIQVGIAEFRIGNNVDTFRTKCSKMKVRNEHYYACSDHDLFKGAVGYDIMAYLDNYPTNIPLAGRVTVTVSSEEKPTELKPNKATNVMQEVYKKMLEEAIGSDLVIIPENGAEVKAHQVILATQSTVFRAMFETEMKETKTHTLEIPDMTEEGVRALLAYLYYREDTKVNADPLLAFEMLQAGHKYNIPVLEADIKKLMLDKPTEWFDVDFAMKLFMFVKNLPAEDGDSLKKKAIKVLKRNSATLMVSPGYVALFKEDLKAAMEFCAYAMGDND